MGGSGSTDGSAALLVDSLKAADREMARAQARQAGLMVQFADARKEEDRQRIAGLDAAGADPRYRPGEFVAMEIGLAVTTTKYHVERRVSMTRRLQTETPDVWDAWLAGDIDELKAQRINHALLKLVREESKRALNMLVVPVAVTKTPELLGRWLNQFVAQAEPEESDERIRRSLEDRYVSVRPDLDGVSFLSACMSSLDAQSVELLLEALAGAAEPGEKRTKQQRRADALVDLLLGRISNGWHGPDCAVDGDRETDQGDSETAEDDPDTAEGDSVSVWNDDDDWDLPAGAFRPDPTSDPDPDPAVGDGAAEDGSRSINCPGRPVPRVTIGVVVSVQSLFGFTDTPGQLADRSAPLPAGVIRELAEQPGTLFHRLLTDPAGNLLDVTELGRFPSDRLAAAIRFRDGVCTNPGCHLSAQRCDLDHVVPWPDGPTAGFNLDAKCRRDHRAKTHAGFTTTLTGGQTTWTTPTGHRYVKAPDPLPVEAWPPDPHDTG